MIPIETFVSLRRRSGNQTPPEPLQFVFAVARSVAPEGAPLIQAYCPGKPLLPPRGKPGGVTPPRPAQYGTSERRYPTSAHQVMYCFGMYWKVTVLSHMCALCPGNSVK